MHITKPNSLKSENMGDGYDYENVFWQEREEGYGGVFYSDNFQSNHPFQSAHQRFDDQDSGCERIRLSPDSDHQEGVRDRDRDSSPSQSSPLGLTLTRTPSFMNMLQKSLNKAKKRDDLGSPPLSEKLKASNFPAFYIRIGSWERLTRHEGDLTAKLYYAKRKLVWEVLEGALKSKIEIQWSDIAAIRANTPENEPGTLEIELNEPPLFYREINPQPRKHTLWQQCSDFTGGQAPSWRRHYVSFPPGVLDKNYEKLLQCDQRLLELAENPFPAHDSPFFDSAMFGVSQLSGIFNGCGSNYQPPYQAPAPAPTIPANNGWSFLSQPPNPSNNNAWSSLHQPPIQAINCTYANSNQPWGEVRQGYYEPNVGSLGIEQQLQGESSHSHMDMDMVSSMTTTYPDAHTTSDQIMAANYYNPKLF